MCDELEKQLEREGKREGEKERDRERDSRTPTKAAGLISKLWASVCVCVWGGPISPKYTSTASTPGNPE